VEKLMIDECGRKSFCCPGKMVRKEKIRWIHKL